MILYRIVLISTSLKSTFKIVDSLLPLIVRHIVQEFSVSGLHSNHDDADISIPFSPQRIDKINVNLTKRYENSDKTDKFCINDNLLCVLHMYNSTYMYFLM